MIETKLFELRDRATFIPVIASRIAPYEWNSIADVYLAKRAGYGEPLIFLARLEGGSNAEWSSTDWSTRTMQVAHDYIAERWSDLASGEVVDVEFILGLTSSPKVSEREAEGRSE